MDSGDVEIATRDWSGCGPDLVLLHGAGPDQRSMARLAAALTPYFRVVTYDQRGCGASSAGPWTFATALDDVHAVIDGYRLTNPVVAGHSLGGIVAVGYAGEHLEAPAVVNIDGWGPGRPPWVRSDSWTASDSGPCGRPLRSGPLTGPVWGINMGL